MPTIALVGPYRVFFFSNEGLEPPHVHVQRDTSLAKFWIEDVALVSATGFSARELRQIERLVSDNQTQWLEAWREFFRPPDAPEGS